MARITLDFIQSEIEPHGWKVKSKEYKNLQTEMEFECDEGHTVYTTWGKLRNKLSCPVCEANFYKEPPATVEAKRPDVPRVLALDQATLTSGWAVFDKMHLVNYGIFEAKPKLDADLRTHQINEWLVSMINNWCPDLVAIEGIQYQGSAGVTTFQALARLQGVLIETCVQLGMPYLICPTNTWRAHCKVKGRTRSDKKKSMQLLVKEWYDISVTDDCADAIGIGRYAASHLPVAQSSRKTENWT